MWLDESFVSNANTLSALQGAMTGHPGGRAGKGVNHQSPEAKCGVRVVSHSTPGSDLGQRETEVKAEHLAW